MIEDMREIFVKILDSNQSLLTEYNGKEDHIHLLLDVHPNNNISNLIGSLKSASSRILRKKYSQHISKFYWGKNAKLWHDSKCIVSCGGAPLTLVKEYIQQQSGGRK